MLTKITRRNISSKLFGWGYNKHNCGYPTSSVKNQIGDIPTPLSSENLHEIKKTISGLSESLLLTKDGVVYSFGLDYLIPENRFAPHPVEFKNKIVDCDID